MALRPLDPAIVNAYQAPKFNMPDPLQDLAAMEQIKNARMSRQIREQDLSSENESRTFLTNIQNIIEEKGGPGLRDAVLQMYAHPNPQIRAAAGGIQGHLDRVDRLAEYAKLNPEEPTQPVTGATTSRVTAPQLSLLEAGPEGAALGTFKNAPSRMPGATLGTIERGNNFVPTTETSTNALIPEQFRQQIQNELARAEKFARYYETQAARDPKGFKEEAKQAREYANSLRKMQSFEPNRLLMMGDVSMMTPSAPAAPLAPSGLAKLLAERDALPDNDPRRKIYDAEILKQTTHAPPVNISLTQSAEKSFGSAFAGALAKNDIDLRDAALNTPEAAGNANRILQTLSTGNVIVGPGAETKLKIAKLLNIVGRNNDEIIANTEQLQKGLASQTLDSIKTSGLGAGQGFTNADRDFLEKARSGNIEMTSETLRRTAELQLKAAEATANKWNTRVKQIPKSAIEGTGLSVEPVALPSKFEARKAVTSDIPQAAIDFLKQGRGTKEQFDAQFGAGSAKRVLGN
jgi:hypothetical protein